MYFKGRNRTPKNTIVPHERPNNSPRDPGAECFVDFIALTIIPDVFLKPYTMNSTTEVEEVITWKMLELPEGMISLNG